MSREKTIKKSILKFQTAWSTESGKPLPKVFETPRYRGVNSSGLIKLTFGQRLIFLIDGNASKISKTPVKRLRLSSIKRTKNECAETENDNPATHKKNHFWIALNSRNETLLIEGRIIKIGRKIEIKTQQKSPRKSISQKKDSDWYEQKWKHITAEKSGGVDPFVCINFAAIYANRSPSTIYRQIKNEKFPAPKKAGNKNVWNLSSIESAIK